jgi:hypothetical protein
VQVGHFSLAELPLAHGTLVAEGTGVKEPCIVGVIGVRWRWRCRSRETVTVVIIIVIVVVVVTDVPGVTGAGKVLGVR